MKLFRVMLLAGIILCEFSATAEIHGDDQRPALQQSFQNVVRPFVKSYCLDCHGQEEPEAKLDLSGYASLEHVVSSHQTWEIILERLEASEMPPPDSSFQPKDSEREAVIRWIRTMRQHEAQRNAGDPGVVLARRLSNAEYNYTIRDLTGVDLQPTKTFPVDPANEAGFDNTGESLTVSPALLKKYLAAARQVSEHLFLTPSGVSFAPHPMVTDTDRDKYCVKQIVEFYYRQPTDLAEYFFLCWRYRLSLGKEASPVSLAELAKQQHVSPKYAAMVWEALNDQESAGPLNRLQKEFQAIPVDAGQNAVRLQCQQLRDYVVRLRPRLSTTFENLNVDGVHKGSQSFVLWKNSQYAANRRNFDAGKLFIPGGTIPEETPAELVMPEKDEARTKYLASMEKFCSVFPDAFYVSERGRDYLGVPREQQEKGRLLSAGFHSMMGYFRDDAPLCELILDDTEHAELDRLWRELDFITDAPLRQYLGFLWFERTDSQYLRDPVFDFARAEDKDAASEEMIHRLSALYLDKARRNGGTGVAMKAIEDFFQNINQQIRWVESERLKSEGIQKEALLRIAARAWRRPLSPAEKQEILEFYDQIRVEDALNHEDAMRDSFVSILMSPHFLFRTDLISSGEGTRSLSRFELANRLSYFLWSSMPDETMADTALLSAADGGTAFESTRKHPAILRQAKVMLTDERIRGLATEFAANWLDIRRFEEHNSVDRERFPEFTDELRLAMFEEAIHFFEDLVRNDRSILELLGAEYTFVNPVLAQHYGMTDLQFSGDEWRRVDEATKYDRGGLLGMSVFLTANSPGLRTSPVKRGYWVVRRLLGERIPPPPPNVPDLPEDESQLGELSLREMLARHRDHVSCAGCHNRFDSIGLAFEGFGPVGERRLKDLGGRPVETVAEFPGGIEGTGIVGVKSYLLEQRQEDFVDNFCRKLLAYALGRGLLLSDEPLIETMKTNLKKNDFRFSSLIESIVTSRQFLTKRGADFLVKD